MNSKNKENFIKSKNYDIVIFVQAPADLRYALAICEQNNDSKILLCVINVKMVYQFVQELKLNGIDVIYFDYIHFNLWKPITYIQAKNKIRKIYREVFSILHVKEVFFFSRFFDWFTSGIIVKILKKRNVPRVYYYNHYDDANTFSKLKKSTFLFYKYFLVAKIISYISESYHVARFYNKNQEFAYWKYDIKQVDVNESAVVSDKYLYKLQDCNDKKVLLFFLSSEDWLFITDKSKEQLKIALKTIKKSGVFLCLKGHPRLSYPKELESYFDCIIPSFVPSEFIDYSDISAIIGLGSTVLAYPLTINAKVKVFSIIKDLDYVDKQEQNYYIDYVNQITKGKIEYVSLADLSKNVSNKI